jgi:hypothetical protein
MSPLLDCRARLSSWLARSAGADAERSGVIGFGAFGARLAGMRRSVLTIATALGDDPQRQHRAELFEAWANLLGNGAFSPAEANAEAKLYDPNEGDAQMAERTALRAIPTQIAADRRGEIGPDRLGGWLSRNTDTIGGAGNSPLIGVISAALDGG